ncbi:MAG: carbohydrate kinase family protein [Cyclobacteriaceae bacterium]
MKKSANRAVCFGEMLYDYLPSGKYPGGAPMNVAVHMQQQNLTTHFISSVGKDEDGKSLRQYLKERGLSTELIQTDTDHPTGKVIADVTQSDDVKYDILQPVAWDFIRPTEEAIQAVLQADLLLYGSLACRHEVTRNTLLSLLPRAKQTSFEVNLRAQHYSIELVKELLGQADLVKVNEEEFAQLSEWYLDGSTNEAAMRKFMQKFDVSTLCITQGAEGAVLLYENQLYFQPSFPIEVADTVGSGDSFLATLLTGLLQEKPPAETLRYACAVGAYVATQTGATPAMDTVTIEKILSNPS